MSVRLINGDCREVLRTLPDASVQCCVTSPPYFGLRSYLDADDQNKRLEIGSERTPDEYVATLVGVFREVWRVLRDDGTAWINIGDGYASSGPKQLGRNDAGRNFTGGGGNKLGSGNPGKQGVGRTIDYGAKPKDLLGIPWMVAFALRADGWYLRSAITWCLSGGTRVYAKTQKGEMPMTIKDMVKLDPSTVQLWNGVKWTQVRGWSETERPDLTYEIELRNGQRIGCTGNHEWPTQRGNVRTDQLHTADSLFAADVIQTCKLPEAVSPRKPAALDDESVGWFVGLYIAEGSQSSGALQIASHVKEDKRFGRLREVASAFHGTVSIQKTSDNGCTALMYGPMLCGIIETYVSGRIASDKHLHPRCWQRTDAFLRAVLDGYLSGDGHWDSGNQRWRLGFCNNDELVADLRTIGARLGITVRLRRCIHTMGDAEFPGYRGEVRFTRSGHLNNKDDGEVVAVRESRARKFWDIGVEDAPNLFSLASGVLTHNSKPNPMPESCTDRPTGSYEMVFLLAKSGTSTYWTHRDMAGTRVIPDPDYRYIHRTTGEERADDPGDNKNWRRVNLWSGHDYFYDIDAIRTPHSVMTTDTPQRRRMISDSKFSSARDKRPVHTGTHEGTGEWMLGINPSGANAKNVWTIATQPFPGQHYATFPPELPERCIKAGTSEAGACPHCGSPWERIIEKGGADREHQIACGGSANDGGYNGTALKDYAAAKAQNASDVKRRILEGMRSKRTTGWRPTCSCPEHAPVPCLVLDCFAGSGTTGMVADRLGRDAVLIELKQDGLAQDRITRDCPLFAEVVA